MDIICLYLSKTNCFLLKADNGYLLVDTGYESDLNIFKQELLKNSINICHINYIFLTHHHDDHSGLINYLVKNNSKIRVIMHKYAVEALTTGKNANLLKSKEERGGIPNKRVRLFLIIRKKLKSNWKMIFPTYQARVTDLVVEQDDNNLLRNLGIGGNIIYTPGHTKDCISIILDNGNCFCGDSAMNNPIVNVLGAKYMTIGVENLNEYYESWNKMLSSGSTTIFPAHGKPFKAKKLEQNIWKTKKLATIPDLLLKHEL